MPIETEEAREFLATRYEPTEVVPAGAGSWSTAFAFTHQGQRLLARFGQHAEDYRKDARAAALYGPWLPIPPVLETGKAFGDHVFAISEWAPGDALDTLPERSLRAALPALLDAMDVLRAAPPPTERGFGFWTSRGDAHNESWRDALLAIVEEPEHPRVEGWQAVLRANHDWAHGFEAAARRLATLAEACPGSVRRVIHSDLTAGNVLVHEGRISAIFDWANSLVGDPLYDAAWLIFWSPWHPGLSADLVRSEIRRRFLDTGECLDGFDERLLACQLHIGLDNLAYNAFRRSAPNLEATLHRLLPLLEDTT